MAVDFSLSLSDLIFIPKFKEAFGKEDKESIKKILFENGMNISDDVEEVVCTHRNLQGKVVNCLRYESTERQDHEWLSSAACTWQNKVDACEDSSLKVELRTLGKESSFTGDLMTELKRHKNAKA